MSDPPSHEEEPVSSLHEHDVLFGRGMGPSMYIGTQKFRELCEPKKQEYKWAKKNKQKVKIAQQVIDAIQAKGGRFLKARETGARTLDDIVNDGTWYLVTDEKEILTKVMQTLRQQNNPSMKRQRELQPSDGGNNHAQMPLPTLSSMVNPTSMMMSAYSGMNLLPHSALVASSATNTGTMDPHSLLLFRHQSASVNAYSQALLAQRQQQVLMQQLALTVSLQPQPDLFSSTLNNVGISFLTQQQHHLKDLSLIQQQQHSTEVVHQPTPNPLLHSVSLDSNSSTIHPVATVSSSNTKAADDEMSGKVADDEMSKRESNKTSPTLESSHVNDKEDVSEDVEEFLMSVLQLSGLPRFTNHAEERANMTNDEKAAALSDMFGKYCNVDMQKSKRARRDLDPESIAFLIKRMRDEIEGIPKSKKQALLEAQENCGEEEFSDERLERFLRCEGMDAQLAAKRFVRYWDKRRQVFGSEKYIMKMTLSEALCDDLTALQAGWVQLLPKVDTSGRQLLYFEPARHKKQGYTSESLLRAAWYVIEVASRANKDIDSGVVELVWDKHSTVWEYDHSLYKQLLEFEASCWPCRFDCYHVCCTPKFIVRVVFPIVSALQSKRCRTRSVWHDVPEHEILSALSEYGITGDMLPTEFGGSIQLNPSEWIAHRRAMEMEEI